MDTQQRHLTPQIPDHTLLRRIGKGSYGEVWLARNIMGAWRAVKVVYRGSFGTSRPYDREFQGIKKFEPVSHANESQIDILHVGRNDAEGYFYYVMELADDCCAGREIDPETFAPRTLHSDLQQHRRLAGSECLQVGITLCKALEHLHAHGLIHRDIKPSNIIFVHGLPKLADIGLVAQIDDTISFVGTEGFVPPEGPGTVRADLYSLGKVLYELHTGLDRSHFPELPTMLAPAEDAALARELNLVILKACASDSTQRHLNAAGFREELELLLRGKSVLRLRNAEKRAVIFRRLSLVAAAIAFVAVIAYISALRANRRAEQSARQAEQQLWNARLAQARASRLSGEVGRKHVGLAAIQAAAKIRPSLELRNEAVAHLALFDYLPPLTNAATTRDGAGMAFDPSLTRRAWLAPEGSLGILELPGGRLLHRQVTPVATPFQIHLNASATYAAAHYHSHPSMLFSFALSNAVPFPAGEQFNRFDPSGELYLTFTNSTVRFRQCSDGTQVAAIESKHQLGGLAAFRSNSDVLALTTVDGIDLWLWRSGELLTTIPHARPVTTLAFNDTMIAIGDAAGWIRLLHLETGRERTWQAHSDVVSLLHFHPTQPLLVSSSYDGAANTWWTDSGRLHVSGTRHAGVQFSPDGAHVGYTSYTRWAWGEVDPPTGYRTVSCSESAKPTTWHLGFSPDGRFLVSRSSHGFQIFRTADWKRVASVPIENRSAGFLNDETFFTHDRKGVRLWPIRLIGEKNSEWLKLGNPTALPIPERTYFEPAVLNWNRRYLTLPTGPSDFAVLDLTHPERPMRFTDAVLPQSIAITHDERFIISGTFHGEGPCVWDVETRKQIKRLEQDNCTIVLSPDGRLVLSAGTSMYRFYETNTWKLLREIPTESGHDLPNPAAWSEDGQWLAIVKERKRVQLLAGSTWEPLADFTSPDPFNVTDLAFSPDNTMLAVATDPDRIEVWTLPIIRQKLRELALDWKDAPWPGVPPTPAVELPETLRHELKNNWPVFPPRDPAASKEMLDLTQFYNARLDHNWADPNDTNNSLSSLEPGTQTLGGTTFDVRGVIQLAGDHPIDRPLGFPAEVRGIPVRQQVRQIHFLGASVRTSDRCDPILAEYRIRYSDGQEQTAFLRDCQQTGDWWIDRAAPPNASRAVEAWRGQNESAAASGPTLHLLKYTWQNPYPDRGIQSLDIISTMAKAAPFIVAITVELPTGNSEEPEMLPRNHSSSTVVHDF